MEYTYLRAPYGCFRQLLLPQPQKPASALRKNQVFAWINHSLTRLSENSHRSTSSGILRAPSAFVPPFEERKSTLHNGPTDLFRQPVTVAALITPPVQPGGSGSTLHKGAIRGDRRRGLIRLPLRRKVNSTACPISQSGGAEVAQP